jgi:hypothetical protein
MDVSRQVLYRCFSKGGFEETDSWPMRLLFITGNDSRSIKKLEAERDARLRWWGWAQPRFMYCS